ncbi:hypothetical protein [Natrinema sp. DC36]|uniref:DUF7534 family protein n=1 Tax=Natrinema sp. DC36 TaxID=2878680 RepID=UPI001CF0A2E0|nr:hypothetical protein [Natrinema sp. DC36]
MNLEKLLQFLAVMVLLSALANIIAAIISPPDPVTQMFYTIPLQLIVPIISYVLIYKNGIAHFKKKS